MVEASISVLGAMVMGMFAWAFNINSEVKVQQKASEDLERLITTRFDALEQLSEAVRENLENKFDSQGSRLDRIERSMNGHLKRD